jgi:hypothetical protein
VIPRLVSFRNESYFPTSVVIPDPVTVGIGRSGFAVASFAARGIIDGIRKKPAA